ncbi:signal transduction histidine kinase [Eubacterium sp. CAG:841]|nr:signal transduction histidine kinase [Eubacterium sp. CAG:841]
MKKLSLQWRITLMTAFLLCLTCIAMNLLLSYSGRHYMDSISSHITNYGDMDKGEPDFFDPEREKLDQELTIIIHGAQESFITTNWYITAVVTLLGGILAYFLSGRALKPLRNFTSQVERVQPNNLSDMKMSEDVLPEFRQFSRSFNQMLDRLDEGFAAQRQFTGNAAHELRTPLALMQAQLELFSAEHPNVLPETANFLRLLREQIERMNQMTKTLLEMSELRTVPCADRIEVAPMIDEIFTDFAQLAERNGITLESAGNGIITGSDTLIYRMLFNLTENAIRYNRPDGTVCITVTSEEKQLVIRVADTGCGIPEQYRESIFQPFFRVDKSRSRENGGVGLGLSLVWEIATLHGGDVRVEKSSEKGTTIAVKLPLDIQTD